MPYTPFGFCAVMHVTALVPCTPSAANVFKSAWMPAPPPLSEPAIVMATGSFIRRGRILPRRPAGVAVAPGWWPASSSGSGVSSTLTVHRRQPVQQVIELLHLRRLVNQGIDFG